MHKFSSPNIIKMPPPLYESQLYFSLRSTWPRGLCLIKFPHPWEKSSTLLHPFYNPPGWPRGLSPRTRQWHVHYALINKLKSWPKHTHPPPHPRPSWGNVGNFYGIWRHGLPLGVGYLLGFCFLHAFHKSGGARWRFLLSLQTRHGT